MAVILDDDGALWEGQDARGTRLNYGIAGAHSVIPFQCETCWMRNLEGRDPDPINDRRYVACLRRCNLDAINSMARKTVEGHVRHITTVIATCEAIGRTPNFPPRGPFPLSDSVGMGWAVDLLMKSITASGKIKSHIQFGAMRKLRSTYTKIYASCPEAVAEGSTFSGTSRVRLTSCPSQSDWFKSFLLGAEDRMGFDTMNQKPLTMMCILKQLEMIRSDMEEAVGTEKSFLVKLGALITLLTAASLRGHEGFYLDIASTRNIHAKGETGVIPKRVLVRPVLTEAELNNLPQVGAGLVGKFKGETGERYHYLTLANETISGLQPRWWIAQLLKVCSEESRSSGYAFNNADGSPPSPTDYNAGVRHYLKQIQDLHPELLDPNEDLIRYGIARTYRKASENRARRAGIPKEHVEAMCRWQTIEKAKGKQPRFQMVDHYSSADQMGVLMWKYNYAL